MRSTRRSHRRRWRSSCSVSADEWPRWSNSRCRRRHPWRRSPAMSFAWSSAAALAIRSPRHSAAGVARNLSLRPDPWHMTFAPVQLLVGHALVEAIKRKARDLGFDLVGVAPAGPSAHREYVREWLDTGKAGDMHYLARRFDERVDPRAYLP